jgi:Fe-S-cluster containining protein
MKLEDQIFLTIQEAVQAICEDFRQYDPQILLFSELINVVSNGRMIAQREPGKVGLWIHQPGESRMRWIEGDELIDFMCELVANTPLDLKTLSAICSRVFRTHAYPDHNPDTNQQGIRLSTGMADFVCKQCGNCCRTLIYFDALTPEDVDAWRQANRDDILEWIAEFPKADCKTVYRVWMKPGTREFAKGCPFLDKNPHENLWYCRIQDVKPKFCRQYPLSRKHALMTGCPGFSQRS